MRGADDVRKEVVYVGRRAGSQFVPYGTGFVPASSLDGQKYQSGSVTCRVDVRFTPNATQLVRSNE